jgi:hypothetical protein
MSDSKEKEKEKETNTSNQDESKKENENISSLTIKKSTPDQVAKISLLILESMGFPKEIAQVALDNITDKENIDEAIEWIQNFELNIDLTNIFEDGDELIVLKK